MALEKRINYYKKCLATANENRDPSAIAINNEHLGNAYLTLGEYRMACEYYEKCLEICTEIGDWRGVAGCSIKLGATHVKLAQYEKAINYYNKSLEISTRIGNSSNIAISNCGLGEAYCYVGKYRKAISYCQKGLEISTATDNQSGIAMANVGLGTAYFGLGEYNKATGCFKTSLAISTVLGDRLGIATSNGNLGNVYHSLGEHDKAIGCIKKALEINTAIGDQSRIAKNNSGLGEVYYRLGEYKKAIGYFKISLEISTAIDDRLGIATANCHLGIVYQCLGEYQKGITCLKKSLNINTAIGCQSGIVTNNSNLGGIFYCLGQYEKSIDYYKTGLEISIAIEDQSGKASINGSLGGIYLHIGEYEKAIDHYKNSLEINTAIGDRSGIAICIGNLGMAYQGFEKYQKAIDYYEKSLEISTAIGDRLGIATNNGNLGNAYFSLGEYHKALDYYKKCLDFSSETGSLSEIASANSNLGNAYRGLGEYKVALSYLMKSITLLDKILLNLVPDQDKLSFAKQYYGCHQLSMSCFLSLERNESALLVIDLGKAKALHCCVEKHKNFVEEDIVHYAQAIWNKIEAREEQMELKEIQETFYLEEKNTSILVFAFDRECNLNVWILNGEFRFRKLDSHFKTCVGLIVELLSRLNVTVTRNFSFFKLDSVSNNNNCQNIIPLKMQSEKSAPKNAVEYIENYGNFNISKILEKLFQLLIDPVKDFIRGNKLIIVPDQKLFFAPFSSLIDENGRYLSNSYSIQITPSLHTLKSSLERPHVSSFGFALFVGNPTCGKVSLYDKEFIPSDLPSAAEEVKYLSKLFQATPLLGRDARKNVVLQHLSRASIIHIAAHGEQNRGEIMLAPNSTQRQTSSSVSKPESYLLTQKDITNISLQARLVVLCCCHTGQGEISSEGVIGITRSFLAAGARSVLAALWPIDDNATKKFMETFYTEFCNEISVCEALRKTMNVFQAHENEEFRSFRIWAPFTIYGEDVKFQKNEIEKIREKSREMFSDFVILP